MFDLRRIPEIEKTPSKFKLLERIPFSTEDAYPVQIFDSVGDEKVLLLLDFETTGLDAETNEPIEIGMVQVSYSPSVGKITSVDEVASYFEQPAKPISAFITQLTGIANEMVEGHKFDDAHVARLVESSKVIIAHNAAFDRSFFVKRFSGLGDQLWGCSAKDVDWFASGFESAKLEYLLLKCGYFYEGHRAAIDCLAMVVLFNTAPNPLRELLWTTEKGEYKVLGRGISYESREVAKKRGYRWNPDARYWWIIIPEDGIEDERSFLTGLCGDNYNSNEFIFIEPNQRYKPN